ncbi:MAG TPA: copper resistance protein B, partial [Allosphingosinicella sp.]
AAAPAAAQSLPFEAAFEAAEDSSLLSYELDPEAADATAPAARVAASQGDREPERGFLQYGVLDRLEWIPGTGEDSYAWDLSGFLGGEKNRVWVGTSGDGTFGGALDYLELQALYSRFSHGWDFQAGLRFDARPHPQRYYATVGAQSDLTDQLWLGAWLFLSNKSEVSARIAGQYNLGLTKRLILQPSFELDAYANDIPSLGIGRGLSHGEAGLRLRYELSPKFAPYLGVSAERLFGRTADLARGTGDEVGTESLVAGVRSEF